MERLTSLAKPVPDRDPSLIEKIKELYPEGDQPVLYRSDVVLHAQISVQFLNNALTVARSAEIIGWPRYLREGNAVRATYTRDELIRVLEYREQLRQEGKSLSTTAKELRREAREKLLTFTEVAAKLQILPSDLKRLVIKGELSFGDTKLDERIKSVAEPWGMKRKWIDPAKLDQESVQQAVNRWQNRYANLENLTVDIFRSHRHLFVVVSEIASAAGLYLSSRERGLVSRILIKNGVEVVRVSDDRQRSWLVLLATEKSRAVAISKEAPELAVFRENPVKLLCGPPVDSLPSYGRLKKDKQRYRRVGSFLRSLGLGVGGRKDKKVAEFFDAESPVTIFVADRNCYFPAEQEKILREFVQRKLA